MKQAILFVDENIPVLGAAFATCAGVHHFSGRALQKADIAECDALIVRSVTRVDRDLLEGTPVRFVATATSGTNHIDRAYLEQRKCGFASAVGANANAVAEYVVYAMLAWARRRDRALRGLSIGIIGFGRIGSLLGAYAQAMGLRVMVNDPPLQDTGFELPAGMEWRSVPALFGAADIVSNHVPLTHEGPYPTRGLIGEACLARLKTGALLVHASRGGVVDESALLTAIATHGLHAAIDVWEHEPYPNVMLARLAFPATPHIAGYTLEGKIAGAECAARAVAACFELEPDYEKFRKALFRPKTNKPDPGNESALLELLEQERALKGDTEALRAALNATDFERARSFDRLRKFYPVRRESLSLGNMV